MITEDRGWNLYLQPIIKNFQNITEFYIDKDQYTLRYRPNPAKKYERLKKHFGTPLYIIKQGKTLKQELSKKMYIQLMEDFAKEIHAEHLQTKLI